jgi:hypothetical protein
MKKLFVLIIINCLISSFIIAQDNTKTDYLRGGIGSDLFSSGKMFIGILEFEYITPINQRFNFGISSTVGYGSSVHSGGIIPNSETTFQAFMIHVDPNIYLRTISIGDFHLYTGLGASLMFGNDILQHNGNGNISSLKDERFSVGGSLVFQFNYDINQDTALGLRLSTQPYINGDISTGMSFNLIKTFNWKTDE